MFLRQLLPMLKTFQQQGQKKEDNVLFYVTKCLVKKVYFLTK